MVCIITYARSWQALVATRALGKEGIKVVTADTENFATSFFSKHSVDKFLYTSPDLNEKKFVQDLIRKCKYYKKKFGEEVVILPIHKETYTISKYKKQIGKHAKLCLEDHSKIMRVHKKNVLPTLLRKHKIPHPKTYQINDVLDLYKIVPKLKFPVFIKVSESAAALGVMKVYERDKLIYEYTKILKEFNLKKGDYPVIQEGVKGKDYCVTAICKKGKLRAMAAYVGIKTYPYKGGATVYRKNVSVPSMEKWARKFLEAIKWHGPVEIDFRMSSDKKPHLIEVNPRFWGGLNQSIASNLNYPYLAYKMALYGDCEKVTRYNKSARTENLVTAVMSLIEEIQQNERKQRDIAKLSKYWKQAFSHKGFKKNISLFMKQLVNINKKKYTRRTIEEFIYRRSKVKEDILDLKDPFVVLGILYPIGILFKYGKINKHLLTGEGPSEKK